MRSKILNAIHKGINEAFIIDDLIEDEKFVKSKLKNIDKQDKQFLFLTLINDKNFEQCFQLFYLTGAKYIVNEEILRDLVKNFNFENYRGFSLNWIDTSKVTDMSTLFTNMGDFDCDISDWDVSNVTNMYGMFAYCQYFRGDLRNWNVSKVIDMSMMFNDCTLFSSNLNKWDVSNVRTMRNMFSGCKTFNKHINDWNVSNVVDMHGMFENCHKFNKPLNKWNVEKVKDFGYMFCGCLNFDQDLSKWNTNHSRSDVELYMYSNCPITTNHKIKFK